jgi:peptide/nickel transport system substrate-binding protein
MLAEEVVFFEEPNRSKAYEMLASGQMHIYAHGLSDPEIKKKIETSKDLTYTLAYGSTWELTINPSGPVLQNGKLNPFAVAPIREALNWLIDRNYCAVSASACAPSSCRL